MDLATLKRSESISAPLLTVIIPAYNVETYLEQCLASILAQESEQIEVLAINDGSTDRTLDILRKIARCDNRIIIVDKPNGGYGSAVNQGLDRASGLYVSIIEPDDFIEGAMHEELLEAAFSYGLPDIIKTPFLRINPIDQYSTALKCGFWNRVKPRTNPFTIAEAPLLMRYHPSIWSAIYRTEFLRNEGIRFDELPGGGWSKRFAVQRAFSM